MHDLPSEKTASVKERFNAAVDLVDRGFAGFEGFLIFILLSAAAVLNFSQVPARYLFGLSFSSAEEISVFLMLWMVFVGMARADRLGQNISIDIVHNFLSEKPRQMLWRISDVLLTGIAFVIAWHAADAVAFSHMLGERSVSKLAAPIWLPMTIIPVTFAVVGVRAMLRAIRGRGQQTLPLDVELRL